MNSIAEVRLWGRTIGAVSLDDAATVASFEYDAEFARSNIEIAPLHMPLTNRVYSFPELSRTTFHGLPGMLSDALPDAFGNTLIDAWLATQGRTPVSFNVIERLCYTGTRGMGALEFVPAIGPNTRTTSRINVDALVELASQILTHRNAPSTSFAEHSHDEVGKHGAMKDILNVGTSAGGARAKAVVAWHPATNEVRSGQVRADDGFEYWLLKFDGVTNNRDKELADPRGFGVVEYAYYRMATDAGITMSKCRLFEENGRHHFMTQRFDRLPSRDKLHMQSLCALAHFDFNSPGSYSYEQALDVARRLGLSMDSIEQLYRRMVFNIFARNQDDHTKNIAFLMNREGVWSLAPAYDIMYAYNPDGARTSRHQMTMNGKREAFVTADFVACAKNASMKRGRAESIIDEVRTIVLRWNDYADEAGVRPVLRDLVWENVRPVAAILA